jgi:hypothetical protein
MPPQSNEDYDTWRAHFDDQFARHGAAVAEPPADLPEPALRAYFDAKAQWEEQERQRRYRVAETGIIFVFVAATILIFLATWDPVGLDWGGEK